MAKFNSLQSSFASGMVSPKFNGRSDLDIYTSAVEELVNMMPTPEGGIRTREAFRILYQDYTVSNHRFCTKQTIIPYVDAKGISYAIVYKYFSNTDIGQLDIYRYDGNAILTRIPYSSGLEAASTIALIKKNKIQWAYIGDALVLAFGSGEPLVIYRRPDNFSTFSISILSLFSSENNQSGLSTNKLHDASRAMTYPYNALNTNKNLLLTATEKVAATASTHAEWELLMKDSNGNILSVWNTAKSSFIIVTLSAYTVIFKTLPNNASNTTSAMRASLVFARGTISIVNEKSWYTSQWDSVNGYPKCVGFSNNRLLLGNTDKFPSTIWLSSSNKIYRFNNVRLYEDATSDVSGLSTTNDTGQTTSSFSVEQGGTNSFSAVKWLMNGPSGFYVGTSNGVEVWTSGSNGALSTSNNYNSQLTNEGCIDTQPVGFSGNIIYVARDGQRLIMMTSEGKTTDLTSLNNEILSKYTSFDKIRRILVNESTGTIFVRSESGVLFGVKLNTIEGKWGIFKYEIPSLKNISSYGFDICFLETNWPSLVAICIQERSSGNYAQLALGSIFTREVSTKDVYSPCLDFSFVGYGGGTVNKVFTLPDALKYTTNDIYVWYAPLDDVTKWYMEIFPYGSYTTTVTLQRDTLMYAIGFAYEGFLKTLDLSFKNSDYGTIFGSIKRLDHVSFRVWNSFDFYFGSSETVGETVSVDSVNSLSAYSGLLNLPFQASPEREARVVIKTVNALPLNISSLVYKGLSSE